MRPPETPLTFDLEAHRRGATLYLRGTMSLGATQLVLRLFGRIPHRIRLLRVDLRGVEVFEESAVEALLDALARWRIERHGMTHLDLPARRAFRPGPAARRVAPGER